MSKINIRKQTHAHTYTHTNATVRRTTLPSRRSEITSGSSTHHDGCGYRRISKRSDFSHFSARFGHFGRIRQNCSTTYPWIQLLLFFYFFILEQVSKMYWRSKFREMCTMGMMFCAAKHEEQMTFERSLKNRTAAKLEIQKVCINRGLTFQY